MTRNLRWKWTFILAVVLGCIVGVIGVPKSTAELVANWNKNIRLGLDLKGGSHIVLQMQVQDAFKSEADATIERLKEVLAKQSIQYASIDRNDPSSVETADTIQIQIAGVPNTQSPEFRRAVNETIGRQWTLTADSSTGY